MPSKSPASCISTPEDVHQHNAAIIGPGVLVSSTCVGALATLISVCIIIGELFGWKAILRRRILYSYSDTSILQAITLQVIGLCTIGNTLLRDFLANWLISLIYLIGHNACVLALMREYQHDRVLRLLRQFLMVVGMIPWSVSGALLAYVAPMSSLNGETTMGRLLEARSRGVQAHGPLVLTAIALVVTNWVVLAIETWLINSRKNSLGDKLFQNSRLLGVMLLAGCAVAAGLKLFTTAQTSHDTGAEHSQWAYGQIMTVVVLYYPTLSAVLLYRGLKEELKNHPPADSESLSIYDDESRSTGRLYPSSASDKRSCDDEAGWWYMGTPSLRSSPEQASPKCPSVSYTSP
ncbi:hypothetical protein B0I35DRAFT_429302 [Stachybotrys elegans]|uniref:Uncharacterized protein n=1 Tax=Stachybotrys elegans TaxID=80388 RepID=A0A8K0T082_9HYPO|nr:hypothetical protein B0I35DRAFT_429302 [Stachybotrys elegans]